MNVQNRFLSIFEPNALSMYREVSFYVNFITAVFQNFSDTYISKNWDNAILLATYLFCYCVHTWLMQFLTNVN